MNDVTPQLAVGQSSRPPRDRVMIAPLTGIRGVAALWVFSYHLTIAAVPAAPGLHRLPVIRSGYLGVDLFFILSGFVLMLTHGVAVRAGWRGARDFAAGRLFRIVPLHWMVLLGFLAALPFMTHDWQLLDHHEPASWVASAFLVQTWIGRGTTWNLPAWSLSAEWLAYLTFPLLARGVARLWSIPAIIACAAPPIALLAVACLAVGNSGLDHIGRLGLLRALLEFPVGMLLCHLYLLRPLSARGGTIALVAGVLLLIVALTAKPLEIAAVVGFALIVLACATPSRAVALLFGNRLIFFLGEISFSIYLLHWLLLEIAAGAGSAPFTTDPRLLVWRLALVAIALVPLAALTWRLIEKPSQRAGRRVIQRWNAASADTVGRPSEACDGT